MCRWRFQPDPCRVSHPLAHEDMLALSAPRREAILRPVAETRVHPIRADFVSQVYRSRSPLKSAASHFVWKGLIHRIDWLEFRIRILNRKMAINRWSVLDTSALICESA